ncbi:hypothetical protein IJ579_04845 [bacterium]|nr:hypothetical protein [bacterium]
MSLNVNYTSLYKQGIDTSVLKEVSSEILNRAAQKSTQFNPSLSTTQQINAPAKPAELGIDLYNAKIDTNTQRQIAANNTLQYQFNEQTLKSIQFLNSQAAINNRIDGKYMPAVNTIVTEAQKASEVQPTNHFIKIISEATAKDKEGSNPFYHGELLNKSKKEEQEQAQMESLKSIFA